MQGAFAGDTPGKMLAFYEDISHGHHNEGLGHEVAVKFENEADSHMMNLANLKGGIDVALDGDFGADVVPYNGAFIANEIDGEEILGQECGPFVPAFRRTPANQLKICRLAAGPHTSSIHFTSRPNSSVRTWAWGRVV